MGLELRYGVPQTTRLRQLLKDIFILFDTFLNKVSQKLVLFYINFKDNKKKPNPKSLGYTGLTYV
jgi:hypothetical protein